MVAAPKLFFAINSLNGGGAERVITNLGNYFYSIGFEVTMVCLNAAKPAYFLQPGIKVMSLVKTERARGFISRLWYGGFTFFKLLSLLIKENPDCVISFMTSANLWVGLTCRPLRIPYLVSERITPDYTINQLGYFMRWISAVIYGQSKAIVVPAKGMIAGFKRNRSFNKLNNFEVINNPVNVFKPASRKKVNQRKFILGVGRLDPQKGFDLLIAAFKMAKITGLDLLISGEGSERKNLEEQISRLGLDNCVKLIGYQENLQDYYQQAELFVLSSRNEGYPNALVEAMSMGCTCISTDCEFGPADIIKNEINGILVKPNSVKSLAEAIKNIINDPVLKVNMGLNAQLINQTNAKENTYAKWEQLVLRHI